MARGVALSWIILGFLTKAKYGAQNKAGSSTLHPPPTDIIPPVLESKLRLAGTTQLKPPSNCQP